MPTINNRFENLTLERLQEIYDLIITPGSIGLAVGVTPITGGAVGRVLFQGAGNVLQESSNLFWDNVNNRLGIGTATPSAIIHSVGSVTAATAIARGNYLQPTLVASANNDVLVGLDIQPTFTIGAFTGVGQIGLRVNGSVQSSIFYSATYLALSSGSSTQPISFYLNQTSTLIARFFGTTGNLLLQNGGTFTDAGYRLDVNGTARIQNQLTTTGSINASSLIARGTFLNQTLVATANNDFLVGLDIQPTFTTGAFTGVRNYAIRCTTGDIYTGSFVYAAGVVGNAGITISSTGTNNVSLATSSTGSEKLRIFGSTGNITIQNGGTFTDAGYRLDVNGSVRTTGSISAAATIARGTYFNQTLVATANNDVLAGLDIAPTFTTGSFTGVTGASLRVNSSIIPSSPGAASLGAAGLPFNNAFFNSIVFSNTYQNYNSDITFSLGYVNTARFFSSTKNFLIQNGGTFVDAGYRLDVNGTTRLQSTLLVSGATTTTGLITANGGITSSLNGYGVTVAANSFFSNDTTRLSQSPATWIWHDLFAFNRYNATYETYDGTTWSSATLNTELFAQKQAQSIQVINTTILASRWTFNSTGWGTGQWLVIGVSWDASIATYNVLVESYDGTAWVTRHTSNSSVAANNYFAYVTAYSGDNQLRVTITRTGGGNNLNISNIKLLTARPGDQGVGSEVEFPYYWNGARSIGIGTSSVINASAILDVGSTTKGFLPPRMSNAQMLAIASPAAGLIVYDTTSQKHFGYNGSSWNAFF